MGWGGISLVARATGLSRPTIMAGLRELDIRSPNERRRRPACDGRGRSATVDGNRSGVAGGPGAVARTRDARRPGVSAAVDLQEHPASGRGTDAARIILSGRGPWPRCCTRRDTACRPTARRAKGRRIPTATPSSSTSTPASDAFLKPGPASDLGGHEEEGIGRRFQEWRPGVAAARRAGRGARPRLPGQDLGQGDPLRRLRHGQQRGLGQRGHRPRHRRVRGRSIRRGGRRWASSASPEPTSC